MKEFVDNLNFFTACKEHSAEGMTKKTFTGVGFYADLVRG